MKIRGLMLALAVLFLSACARLNAQGSQPLPAALPTARKSQTAADLTTSPTPSPTARRAPTRTPSPTVTATRTPSLTPTLPPDWVYHPAGAVAVPILLYHRVTDRAAANRYAVSTAAFRAQMKFLAEQGYATASVSQLAAVIRDGGYLPVKPIVITFDDGFVDVYENAFPILQEYGFRATVYVITGVLETNLSYGYMQPDALKELADAGWEIGSHSVSHSDLKTSPLGMGVELDQSKQDLEARLGVEVRSFAYPFAAANDWIKEQVSRHGYTSAVGVGTLNRHTLKSLYFLSRREIYNNTSLAAFQKLLILPPEPTATPTSAQTTPP